MSSIKHAPEVEQVMRKGDGLLQQVRDLSPERSVITNKVKEVGYKFEDLRDKLEAHRATIAENLNIVNDFNEKTSMLETWIHGAHEQLATLGPISTDPVVLEKQLRVIQVF